ncbi:MAG: hypothetical protein KKF93_01030 [Candidatus Omnitrophica bacterium]|nr:hypothetical protein [Candidatus Omnitrophota bacterium]MBU2062958.1 hypothetical protein [Candidatus Omnitrophota bacterium]
MKSLENKKSNFRFKDDKTFRCYLYSSIVVLFFMFFLVKINFFARDPLWLLWAWGILAFLRIFESFKFYLFNKFLNKKTQNDCLMYSLLITILMGIGICIAITAKDVSLYPKIITYPMIIAMLFSSNVSRFVYNFMLKDIKQKIYYIESRSLAILLGIIIYAWFIWFDSTYGRENNSGLFAKTIFILGGSFVFLLKIDKSKNPKKIFIAVILELFLVLLLLFMTSYQFKI